MTRRVVGCLLLLPLLSMIYFFACVLLWGRVPHPFFLGVLFFQVSFVAWGPCGGLGLYLLSKGRPAVLGTIAFLLGGAVVGFAGDLLLAFAFNE